MQQTLDLYPRCAETFKQSEASKYGVDSRLVCDRIKVCCNHREDWPLIQIRTGGYDLPQASRVPNIPRLQNIINSIEGDMSHIEYLKALPGTSWAMPYSRALAGNLEDTNRLRDWLEKQSLLFERQLIFHQESKDVELERLYLRTFLPNFFLNLATISNNVCISPGYSVYDNGSMCRHHQLYNMKRSLDFFVRACEHGIPCVPCLGWSQDDDLRRIGDWLMAHPTLRYAAINCQTIRRKQFPEVAGAMQRIEDVSRSMHWVVFGGDQVLEYLIRSGFRNRLHLISGHIQSAKANRNMDAAFRPYGTCDLFVQKYKLMDNRFRHYVASAGA